MQVVFSALLLTGVGLVLTGASDPVRVVALVALAARFTGPLAEVGALSGSLRAARGVLAEVVVLDEATAALDAENARSVTASLRVLAQRSTVVVVSRRLSTVVDADQIVVLDAGRVAESGTHAELLARGGRYAALWEARRRARGWRLGAADA